MKIIKHKYLNFDELQDYHSLKAGILHILLQNGFL